MNLCESSRQIQEIHDQEVVFGFVLSLFYVLAGHCDRTRRSYLWEAED